MTNENTAQAIKKPGLRRLSFYLTPGGSGKANFFYGLFDLHYFDNNWLSKKDLYSYGGDTFFLFDMLKKYEFYSRRDVYLFKRVHSGGQGQLAHPGSNKKNNLIVSF